MNNLYKFAIVAEKNGNGYFVHYPELRGCYKCRRLFQLPISEVIIVGKTKWGREPELACVDALSLPDGQPLRLKSPGSDIYWQPDVFKLREVHEIDYYIRSDPRNPHHKENALVRSQRLVRKASLDETVSIVRQSDLVVQTADPREAFQFDDGQMHIEEENGTLFLTEKFAPYVMYSIAFMVSKTDVVLNSWGDKYEFGRFKVKYKGFQKPVAVIRAGRIIRLSTAGLWEKEGTDMKRAYLQVSGWF